MSESVKKPVQVSQKSPFSGCILIIAVCCSFLFILVFSFFSLFKQDSEIRQFTSSESKPVPVSNPEARANDVAALDQRLENFAEGLLESEEPRTLRLTADDLNVAIGAHDEFSELRESFFVEAIEDGKLRIQVNEALNGAPMSGESYYLTGTIIALPRLADEEVVLQIEEIRVPGKSVPDGFLGNYSPRRILQRYRDHEKIGPVMRAIKEVEVEDDAIVITAGIPEPPGNEGVAKGLSKVFGLVFLLALVFIGLAILAIKFTKSSR